MLRNFLLITATLFLVSCGGGSDDEYYNNDPYYNQSYDTDYSISYFHIKDLDNIQYRVGNLYYDCGMLKGVTDSEGSFDYEEEANCIFYFYHDTIRYDLGYVSSNEIGRIYIYDLQNVTDESLLDAIIDAMDTQSLEITRY